MEGLQAACAMLGEIKRMGTMALYLVSSPQQTKFYLTSVPNLDVNRDFISCPTCHEHIKLPVESAGPLNPSRSFKYYSISFFMITTILLEISYFRLTELIWIAVGMVLGLLTPIAYLY